LGGAIIKISTADRSKFILGQLIILGAIFIVTLAELTQLIARLCVRAPRQAHREHRAFARLARHGHVAA
jgi:hypothetical protein